MGAEFADRTTIEAARLIAQEIGGFRPPPGYTTETLFVGYVPGWPGAHSQGESLDELHCNLLEVIGMLLEDGEPTLESEFVGVQTIRVG